MFLDESGAKTDMTRLYARSFDGERIANSTPQSHWHTTTMISSLRLDGDSASMAIEGATCDEEAHKLKEQGFGGYLKKPFTMEELRKCVAGKRSETIHSSTSRSVLNQQAKKPIS